MLHQSPPLKPRVPSQSPRAYEKHELHLDPGVSKRRPRRSTAKWCLLTTLVILILAGCSFAYIHLKKFWYNLQHPHQWQLHPSLLSMADAADITDWSEYIRPMILESDSFDIVASVWVQDVEGKDGYLDIDGQMRPERLVYSDTVFRDLRLGGKTELTNVSLRVPIKHFKQTNISNYDLRASFVLVQSRRPPWLDGVRGVYTWKPPSYRSPNMRYWPAAEPPSVQDQIYDSFGITIPLIEFHNIPPITPKEDSQTQVGEARSYTDSGAESDPRPEDDGTKFVRDKGRWQAENTFRLSFTGNYLLTDLHPYIVTRTHLGIFNDGTNIGFQVFYERLQRSLSERTCINPITNQAYKYPRWYQCVRSYVTHGVLETMVVSSRNVLENDGASGVEYLYAPHLAALQRVSGPKDVVPLPLDKESHSSQLSQGKSSTLSALTVNLERDSNSVAPDEDFVDVTWRLMFSGHSPAKEQLLAIALQMQKRPNVSAPENELLYEQHQLEQLIGILGYRSHEDAHPRRIATLNLLVSVITVSTSFLIIHYWITRTSTNGISRLGTVLYASGLVLGRTEPCLLWIMSENGVLTFTLIAWILMNIDSPFRFKVALRIKFGSPGIEKSKERGWITGLYIAKATHAERTSDRIEARLPARLKIQLVVALFAIIYRFELPYRGLISPVLAPPKPAGLDALMSLHPYASPLLSVIHALQFTGMISGEFLQMVMNAQSRTFAGKYKTTAVLLFVGSTMQVFALMPVVFGRSRRSSGLGLLESLQVLRSFLELVQVIKYRSAKSENMDETEE